MAHLNSQWLQHAFTSIKLCTGLWIISGPNAAVSVVSQGWDYWTEEFGKMGSGGSFSPSHSHMNDSVLLCPNRQKMNRNPPESDVHKLYLWVPSWMHSVVSHQALMELWAPVNMKGAQELLEHLCSVCAHVCVRASGIFTPGAIVTEVSSEQC